MTQGMADHGALPVIECHRTSHSSFHVSQIFGFPFDVQVKSLNGFMDNGKLMQKEIS